MLGTLQRDLPIVVPPDHAAEDDRPRFFLNADLPRAQSRPRLDQRPHAFHQRRFCDGRSAFNDCQHLAVLPVFRPSHSRDGEMDFRCSQSIDFDRRSSGFLHTTEKGGVAALRDQSGSNPACEQRAEERRGETRCEGPAKEVSSHRSRYFGRVATPRTFWSRKERLLQASLLPDRAMPQLPCAMQGLGESPRTNEVDLRGFPADGSCQLLSLLFEHRVDRSCRKQGTPIEVRTRERLAKHGQIVMPSQEFTKPLPQIMFVDQSRWTGLLQKLQVILSLLDGFSQLMKPAVRGGTEAGPHDAMTATVLLPHGVEKPCRPGSRKLEPRPVAFDAIEQCKPFGHRWKCLDTPVVRLRPRSAEILRPGIIHFGSTFGKLSPEGSHHFRVSSRSDGVPESLERLVHGPSIGTRNKGDDGAYPLRRLADLVQRLAAGFRPREQLPDRLQQIGHDPAERFCRSFVLPERECGHGTPLATLPTSAIFLDVADSPRTASRSRSILGSQCRSAIAPDQFVAGR